MLNAFFSISTLKCYVFYQDLLYVLSQFPAFIFSTITAIVLIAGFFKIIAISYLKNFEMPAQTFIPRSFAS